MPTLSVHDDLARAVVDAIRSGDLVVLGALLADEPWLARVWLDDNEPHNTSRSLLHIVTDWPGHFPRGAETVRLLVAAGADVDARSAGHTRRPLCTGRPAVTTSRYSTRCSTPARTSTHEVR